MLDKPPMKEVAERALGVRPKAVRISKLGGMGNTSYALTAYLDSVTWEKLSIKVYSGREGEAKKKLQKEVSLFKLLRKHGVGVPDVLYVDDHGELLGRPLIVKRWIYAENSDRLLGRDATRKACLNAVADALVRMHSIPLDEVDKRILPAPKRTSDYARSQVGILRYICRLADIRVEPLLGWLEQRVRPAKRYVLVHGDYCPDNVLVDRRMKAYLIDLESSEIGDPMCDLAYAYHFLRVKERIDRKISGLASSFIVLYESRLPVDMEALNYYKVVNAIKILAFLRYIRRNLLFIKKFHMLYPLVSVLFLKPMMSYLKDFVASCVPDALANRIR